MLPTEFFARDLSAPAKAVLVAVLASQKPQTMRQVAESANLGIRATYRHLEQLIDRKLVHKIDGRGRSHRYISAHLMGEPQSHPEQSAA
jgi:predicted ArsR family transcriptional regulator